MKTITVWDILTILVLLVAVGLIIVFAQIFINPQVAYNPLPPPTMVPTVGIPTSTPTLKSLPPTWTPPPDEGNKAARTTLRPSQTGPPPNATVHLLYTYTITPTGMPTDAPLPSNTPIVSNTPLPINAASPTSTALSINFATPTKTLLPAMLTSTPTSTSTIVIPPPPVQNTSTPTTTATSTPTTEPTIETPPAVPSIVWKATHEDGDLREWQEHGDFITQGSSAYYSMITSPAHSGNYAVALTIDTEGYSSSGDFAAYLFYWDQLPGDAYYYSAWYFIPPGTQPQDWWNVWQWKSTYNGSTDNSVPMYALDIREKSTGQLSLQLIYRPDIAEKIDYRQNILYVPTDQWFQIEAYYKKGVDNTGQVIVWQDGTEIFNLSSVKTTESDNTVYWSVNHYTDYIIPNPSSIYIDDAAISTERLGPNYTLP
ncbi:MAG: heparin lyase I family protein [Anaerolineaceae bacterium]|nr:heparin lyase I family protein [Anaerolineaceae bacterium]